MLRIVVLGLFAGAVSAYCTAGATNPDDSNPGPVRVTGLNTITYSPPCPGVTGLDDQTNTRVTLAPGGSYSMTVDWSTCGTSYSGVGEVWVDWNQNQVFDEATESIGTWVGSPTQTSTFTIAVPASAVRGSTRMRVMQREGGSLPLNPCATFSWGGAIDFGVNIGNSAPGMDGGLSGGSVLLIILVIVIPLYIGGGCYFYRTKKGTTGMVESCPHNEFWCLIPGLVKDGCQYSLLKTKVFIQWAKNKHSGSTAVDGHDEL